MHSGVEGHRDEGEGEKRTFTFYNALCRSIAVSNLFGVRYCVRVFSYMCYNLSTAILSQSQPFPTTTAVPLVSGPV